MYSWRAEDEFINAWHVEPSDSSSASAKCRATDREARLAIAGAPLIYSVIPRCLSIFAGHCLWFVLLTFMVLIADHASSIVLTGTHSTSCGRSSWLTISMLLPFVRMEVSGAIGFDFVLVRA